MNPPPEADWRLILVNSDNPIPKDYQVDLKNLKDGQAVDKRIYPDLQEMFDDARTDGIMPTISSSYRTTRQQQQMLDDKIKAYKDEGHKASEAKKMAKEWVAKPGTSEHQIGLAVDITTEDKQEQDTATVWQWFCDNCYKYGFIQRYPEAKTDITGVINEPWHFRYVGKETAAAIYNQGVCLEEYLAGLV